MTGRHRAGRQEGFTLIELIIVMAIIGILATMVIPQMRDTPMKAKEAVLKADLHTFRDVIDQFFADRGHYPEDLQDLVAKGYLRALPPDPFTKSSSTWVPVFATNDQVDQDPKGNAKPGIYDVKSGSSGMGTDGRPYSEW
jgi:general secretion pathway protein G